jgi:hypothetical protein
MRFLLIVLVLISTGFVFAADPGTTELTELKRLNAAAMVLLAAADETVPTKEICGLQSSDGFNLSRPLQAKIDEKIGTYVKARAPKGSYGSASMESTCIASCECGLYASILESVGYEKLNPADQQTYHRVSSLAIEQSKPDVANCARKTTWFCQSDLLSSLRKEAAQ